ncbi:MAG TPA: T9SS type A sorting domain-containing protein [Fulvivirga sp.]|nr:T9SS type A sorting domain-containing protein [Fulvivirga sp.]
MKRYKYIVMVVMIFGSFSINAQTIFYVDAGATGANNGTSWPNAFIELQTAIDVAEINSPAQVWVKAGTYYPTAGTDRTISFIMKNDVEIYGGFAGAETLLSQRDWKANETILSGDIGVLGNKNDNTLNVINNDYLSTAPLTASAILDGVIVENGFNTLALTVNGGAGIRNTHSSPIIRNCTIRNNELIGGFGSGILNTGESNPTIVGCIFYKNINAAWGGAISYRAENRSNTFVNNTASTIANCVFYENTAGQVGGAIYISNYLVHLINNTITENEASGSGGAGITYLEFDPGGPNVNDALYINNIVWGNISTNASGLSQIGMFQSGPQLTNNIVEGGLVGTNSIDVDPLFNDVPNNDFSINYCGSSAIDAGTSTNLPIILSTDIDQNTRVFNGTIDIGAYESQIVMPFYSAIETTDVSCFGAADGEVSMNAGGGVGTVSFSVDGINYTTNTTITGLDIGSYTLSMKDANNCITTSPITILQPTELILSSSNTNVTCNGDNDGSITVNATGSSGTYQYQLNAGVFQSSNIFPNLGAGSYVVTVRDQGTISCVVSTGTITITEPGVLSIPGINKIDVTCNGADDGIFAFSRTGGTPPYEQSLDGINFQSSSFSNLSPGSYTMTMRDSKGCTVLESFVINEPSALELNLSKVDLICNGGVTGEIDVIPSGGTSPYEYALDGTTFQSSTNFSSLSAGSYTVTIKDGNSCTTTESIQIIEPDAFDLNASLTHITCSGNGDGSITLAATGGTSPYEYSIDGVNFSTTTVYGNLSEDEYTISLIDVNACTYSEKLTITSPDVLTASTSVLEVTCSGESDGASTITASGGTAPYEYSIDGTNFQSDNEMSGLSAGNYTVTIRDANSCTSEKDFEITEPDVLTLSAAFDGSQAILTPIGGTAPYSYSVDGTAFQSASNFILGNGQYTFTVKDANDCTTSTDQALVITATEDAFARDHISIYPNPVTTSVVITGLSEDTMLRLIDNKGNVVKQKKANGTAELLIDELGTGLYILQIVEKGKPVHNERLIIK